MGWGSDKNSDNDDVIKVNFSDTSLDNENTFQPARLKSQQEGTIRTKPSDQGKKVRLREPEGPVQQLVTARRRANRLIARAQKSRLSALSRARYHAREATKLYQQEKEFEFETAAAELKRNHLHWEVEFAVSAQRSLEEIKRAFERKKAAIVWAVEDMVMNVQPIRVKEKGAGKLAPK